MSLLEILNLMRILTQLQMSFPAVFSNGFYRIDEQNALVIQN